MRGDYVHIDVSDSFTTFGKGSTVLVFVLVWLALLVVTPGPISSWVWTTTTTNRNENNNNDDYYTKYRTVVCLCGALFMVAWRNWALQSLGFGPYFDVRRSVPMEPLLVLFGCILLSKITTALHTTLVATEATTTESHEQGGSTSSAVAKSLIRLWKVFVWGAIWIQPSSSSSSSSASSNDSDEWSLSMALTLGSGFAITGSITGLLIWTLAYDDIKWLHFTIDMILPTLLSMIVLSIIVSIMVVFLGMNRHRRNRSNGSAISNGVGDGCGLVGGSGDDASSSVDTTASTDPLVVTHDLELNEEAAAAVVVPLHAEVEEEEKKEDDDNESLLGGSGDGAARQPQPSKTTTTTTTTTMTTSDGGNVVVDNNVNNKNNNSNINTIDDNIIMVDVTVDIGSRRSNSNNSARNSNNNSNSSSSSSSNRMTLILVRTLAVLSIVCFMVGLDLVLVALVTAAIGTIVLTIHQQWSRKNTAQTNNDDANDAESNNVNTTTTILNTLDYTPLIYIASQFVLIGGMVDTGVPQMFFYYGMGQYSEYMTGGIPNLIRFMICIGILTILTSPIATVIMLAASIPYAYPYDWIQIAWIVTMTSRFSVFATIDGRPSSPIGVVGLGAGGGEGPRRKNNMLYNIPFSIIMCIAGSIVLNSYHISKECSVRLGTCDDYEGDGGWRS